MRMPKDADGDVNCEILADAACWSPTPCDYERFCMAILADAILMPRSPRSSCWQLVSRGVIGEAEVHSYIDQLPNTTPQVEPA
jgi:hypothetical protein